MWWSIGAVITVYVALFFYAITRRRSKWADTNIWVIRFFFPLTVMVVVVAIMIIFMVWAAAESFSFLFGLERKRDYHPDPFY